jgi:hypothetical protein
MYVHTTAVRANGGAHVRTTEVAYIHLFVTACQQSTRPMKRHAASRRRRKHRPIRLIVTTWDKNASKTPRGAQRPPPHPDSARPTTKTSIVHYPISVVMKALSSDLIELSTDRHRQEMGTVRCGRKKSGLHHLV